MNRQPTPPGEILVEEFLKPLKLTQGELASKMGVPIQRVNSLINGKRGVTVDTALRLSWVFGTSPEFWLSLQIACDLHRAKLKRGTP